MNKTAITFLALGALAGTASAQSSVTLFGVMDLAIRSTSNEGVGSQASVISGGNTTSRFGFRGTEDLGGGLSAGFWLESLVAGDTGVGGSAVPAGQLFDRRATVSLVSKSVGELRVGRDFVPTYTNWGRFDPFSYVGVGSASNLVVATQVGPIRSAFSTSPNTLVRSSNAVQYLLPTNAWGLEGGVMFAPDEGGSAANGQHKHLGARLGYAAGPLQVSAAFGSTKNNLTVGERFNDSAVGAAYNFGVVKLSAGVRQFKFLSAKQTNVLLGAAVPLGAGQLNLSWNRANLAGAVGATRIDANDANQFAVGYVHSLSKRTALYTNFATLSNKGGATFTVPGGPAGMAGGGTSRGMEMGLRHNF